MIGYLFSAPLWGYGFNAFNPKDTWDAFTAKRDLPSPVKKTLGVANVLCFPKKTARTGILIGYHWDVGAWKHREIKGQNQLI